MLRGRPEADYKGLVQICHYDSKTQIPDLQVLIFFVSWCLCGKVLLFGQPLVLRKQKEDRVT